MARGFDYWHREAVERGKPDPVRWAQLKVNQQQPRWHANDAVVHRSRTDKPGPPPSHGTFASAWEKEQARRADDAAATLHLPGLDPLPALKPTEYLNAWRYEQKQQAELRKRQRRRTALRAAPAVVSFLAAFIGFLALALHLFF